MSEIGHNVIAKDQLRSIIERVENLESEIKERRSDQRDIFAEAKGNGYCPKTLRKIVAIRKKDPVVRAEESVLLETYLAALGME